MTDLSLAYEHCEEVTRAQARNFAYGIRLLPESKRRAMSALYAFARRVDDVGDGDVPLDEKIVALSQLRNQIAQVASGDVPQGDLVLLALSDVCRNYPVPIDALGEIVSGCEMDCQKSHYSNYEELDTYCRFVAGSIGRLSLSIFGNYNEASAALADTLGVGLQLTNILRDIVEDREVMGRIYLPVEDLVRFGCDTEARGPTEGLVELIRFEVGRAKESYRDGLGLLLLLDHRSKACVAAMAGIYYRLLIRIERDPLAVLDRRVSLPTWEKAWVAARSLAGAGV